MISCRGVSKRFYVYEHRTTSLQEAVLRSVRRQPIHVRRASFQITDLTVEIGRGEAVALVGPNGSGKSTALRLMAGIYPPTEGTIERRGRIVPVIELGSTFHTDLTGAENVELYAAALGFTRRDIAERFDEIVDFAGIDEFIDVPLKYYSSGMRARLAFSVSICARPDALLLDEVLAVGDAQFRQRCADRIRSFHEGGGTLVAVSHDMDSLRHLCSRAVWLDHGRTRMAGATESVLEAYLQSAQGTS